MTRCEVDLCRWLGQHHYYLARLVAVRRTPAQHVAHHPIALNVLLVVATIRISLGGR